MKNCSAYLLVSDAITSLDGYGKIANTAYIGVWKRWTNSGLTVDGISGIFSSGSSSIGMPFS